MKKSLPFLAVCLFLSSLSFAQQSGWYAGGTIGFQTGKLKASANSISNGESKGSQFDFAPQVYRFVNEHLTVGAGLTYSVNKQESKNLFSSTSRNEAYGAMVFTRYFWGKQAFRPFAGFVARFDGGKSTVKDNFQESKSTTTTLNFSGTAGFSYQLSKRVVALGSFGLIGYTHSVSKYDQNNAKSVGNSFGIDASSVGNRFDIGFFFSLGKKG